FVPVLAGCALGEAHLAIRAIGQNHVRARDVLDERSDLVVVGALELPGVAQVRHAAGVVQQDEALTLEVEATADAAGVADVYLVGLQRPIGLGRVYEIRGGTWNALAEVHPAKDEGKLCSSSGGDAGHRVTPESINTMVWWVQAQGSIGQQCAAVVDEEL